jgi:hypothetical protein
MRHYNSHMLESTAAQPASRPRRGVIALPTVYCITGIGLASDVFTYYLDVREAASLSMATKSISKWDYAMMRVLKSNEYACPDQTGTYL